MVGVRRRNVAETGNTRFEGRPVRGDAGGAHCREGNPMVTPYAADNLGFFRFALRFPVVTRQLEVAVGRLTATRGEIKVIDLRIANVGQTFGEFDCRWIRAAVIARAESHFLHLLARSIDQWLSAMPETDVPQTGQSIDETVTVGVDQVGPLGLYPDLCIRVCRILVQGMNHVFLIFFDQGAVAEGGIHSQYSLS